MKTTKGAIEIRRRHLEDKLDRINRRRGKPRHKYIDLLRMLDVVVAPQGNSLFEFEIKIGEIGPYLDVENIRRRRVRDAYSSLSPISRSRDDTAEMEKILRTHTEYSPRVKYTSYRKGGVKKTGGIRIKMWIKNESLSEGMSGMETIDSLLRQNFPYYESRIPQPKS